MQDKWAIMLINMADSDTNLQNQIFPYVLSQISIEEFDVLKDLQIEESKFSEKTDKINSLAQEVKDQLYSAVQQQHVEIRELRKVVAAIKLEGFHLDLEEFEIANLLRLGLVRQLPPRIYIEEFSTGGISNRETKEEWHNISAEYDPDDYGFRITELGTKFLQICELKDKGK